LQIQIIQKYESISPWHTAPKTASCNGNDNNNNIDSGSMDHFASLALNNAITPVKVAVTKLEVTKDNKDYFNNSWGEEDDANEANDAAPTNATDGSNENNAHDNGMDKSDKATERMREESKRIAQQIMLKEQEKECWQNEELERMEQEEEA